MSSVTRVPETAHMRGGELTADDARATLRHYGRRHLAREAFARFRYGDGFSHARALGLQFVLAIIPLVIAAVGLSDALHTERFGEVLRRTLVSVAPGSSRQVVEQTLARPANEGGRGAWVALVLGLLTALVALTTAMGQVERGANRIYGIGRDRPSRAKYGRAALMAVTAGLPALLGFLVVVAGGSLADAVRAVYGAGAGTAVSVLRWPVGVVLVLAAITVMLRFAPRRAQPGATWLAFGAGIALVLWLLFTGLLVLYVEGSSSFGTVYGPLTGVVALLLWANLTSVALLLGIAFAAQLEAVRAGVRQGATPDPELTRLGGRART